MVQATWIGSCGCRSGDPEWSQLPLTLLAFPLQPPPFGPSLTRGMGSLPPSGHERSATDLAAKLLLLDELVSLENDVTETKKKRSFSGFGSPLDRLSAGSVDLKTKQRWVV